MFVNKLHADYEPLAYSCLEERIFRNVENDFKGVTSLDLDFYADSDLAKYHLAN